MEDVPEKKSKQSEYYKAYRLRNIEECRKRDREKAAKRREANREAYNASMREWLSKNKERVNAERRAKREFDLAHAEKLRAKDRERYAASPKKHRSSKLKSKYGITIEEYEEMYKSQNGLCSICGKHKPDCGHDGLVVDHCHEKGHVRELLCASCNHALGKFNDNIATVKNAVKYLIKHKKE